MRAVLWVFVALLAFVAASSDSDKKIVCYFGSWAIYRPGNGKIDINEIDPTLCTHLIYTFVGITTEAGISILDPWADLPTPNGLGGYDKFNNLRQRNPHAKTMVAIGGWNEGSTKYSTVVAKPELRKKFVENAVDFVKKYGFDGFDFDWEYPNQRGGNEGDKKNYVLLLKEMRKRFDEEGLILSAAVGAAQSSASQSYIISEVAKYLHFINLMAYDLHGVWDKKTGINAPLYPGSWEQGAERLLNVDACIHYWLEEGAPAEKLILGIPLYGRTFTLDNAQNNKIGAPASQPGTAGPYSREPGNLGYNEICEMQKNDNGWDVHFEEEQKVPYMVKGNQWVGYEDTRSIKEKAEYVKKLGLGGAMVWSVETDDFKGICGSKNPLLTTLNHVLRDGVPLPPPPPTTTEDPSHPTSSTTTSTTTEGGNSEVKCDGAGFIRDPDDCAVFYQCTPDPELGYRPVRYVCPSGTVFDTVLNVCNWPNAVDCSLYQVYQVFRF